MEGFVGFRGGSRLRRREVGSEFRDHFQQGVSPDGAFEEFVFEFGADIGLPGPFPEFLFALFLGIFEKEGEALLFDGDAAGVEVAAAQGDDVGGQLAEPAEVSVRVLEVGGESMGGGGEAEGEPLDEFIGEVGAGSGHRIGRGGFGLWTGFTLRFGLRFEEGSEVEGVLAHLPGAEAELGPFMEVLPGDELAGEVVGEDGLDFGEGVEPGEESFAGFAVVEAAVELVADGFGEAGNFAVHG